MTENTSKQPSPDGIVFGVLPKDKRFKNLTGNQFAQWTVLGYSRKLKRETGTSQKYWWCQCSCGAVKEVNGCSLLQGTSRSCGCLKSKLSRERATKHGMADSSIYKAWQHMHGRCSCPNDKGYMRYGARGIRVCQEWSGPGGFQRFYDHVGDKPTPYHSIGRIDNDGNYEPGNVRWEDDIQQANNKSTNVVVPHNGELKTIAQWARESGLARATLSYRLKNGKDVGVSIATKSGDMTAHRHHHNGKSLTIREWSVETGISEDTIASRLWRGWSIERSLTAKVQRLNPWKPKATSEIQHTSQPDLPSHPSCQTRQDQ